MRSNKKKVLAFSVLASVCLSSMVGSTSLAGWFQEGDNWRYSSVDGEVVSGRWVASGDIKYYLNDEGLMAANNLLEIEGSYYYFDESGRMVQNQWILIDSEDGNHWYYFGQTGKAYRRSESNFVRTIGDKLYIFDDDGKMVTGWIDDSGNEITESDTPFLDAIYYCDEDGALYQNRWLKYVDGSEHDLESEIGGRIYGNYEEVWFRFGQNGKKLMSSNTETATEREIDGKTYGFDENGVMLNWWGPIATDSNATKFYSGYDGGHLLYNTWVWMYPSEFMSEWAKEGNNDYFDEEASWWYTQSNGQLIRNRIKLINGQKYAFDDIGRMQTGFVLFNGTTDYVAQYEMEDLESWHFINGGDPDNGVVGFEKSDIYLFGPDELNDGSMKTGKDMKIELADGTFTFGFSSSGKAYGTRNILEKQSNKFYINGLRLDAEENMKYGVVEYTDEYNKTGYYVVNTSGTIQKGNKALKDGFDNWFIIINGEFKAYVKGEEKPKWYNGKAGQGFYHYQSDGKVIGNLIAKADDAPDLDIPVDGMLNFD